MDEAHDRPEGTAKRAYHKHKDKLVDGEDYYYIARADASTLNVLTSEKVSEHIVALTETGYLMLVKTFRDPLAWSVQRRLVKVYFAYREAVKSEPSIDISSVIRAAGTAARTWSCWASSSRR